MSLFSENEARTRWCPLARASNDGEPPVSINRIPGSRGDRDCHCLASGCMAWRWADPPGPTHFAMEHRHRETIAEWTQAHCYPRSPVTDEQHAAWEAAMAEMARGLAPIDPPAPRPGYLAWTWIGGTDEETGLPVAYWQAERERRGFCGLAQRPVHGD